MDEDLRGYGYAPGNYYIKCKDCLFDKPFGSINADKRSYRCKEHAVIARNNHKMILDSPLICDMEHLFIG